MHIRPAIRSLVAALPVVALLVPSGPAGPARAATFGGTAVQDSIAYASIVADGNLLGLTLTNYGVLGNNFTSRAPSFEYPLGAGYEHMATAGLWIGAHAVDGGGAFTGVTTGVLDCSQGVTTTSVTEFTPAGTGFIRRSTLPNSPDYDPAAVSELDDLADFSDRPAKTTTSSPEPHRPLGVLVRQKVYSWGTSSTRDFVYVRYTVINLGAAPLADVWVGLDTEFVSGNKSASANWPPSGWFSKEWLQYDPAQRLLRGHYCAGQPVPGACNLPAVPYWAGVALLTAPLPGQSVTLAGWRWAPSTGSDADRYSRMSAGTIADLTQADLMPVTGDPMELLALGPFASLAPGDSVTVDFALVGGGDVAGIQRHADAAQVLHSTGFNLLAGVHPPRAPAFAVHGVRPNPSAAGPLDLAFAVERPGAVRVELLDIAGRVALAREVTVARAGEQLARLGDAGRLAPGVYLARITQSGRSACARVVIVR